MVWSSSIKNGNTEEALRTNVASESHTCYVTIAQLFKEDEFVASFLKLHSISLINLYSQLNYK